ncbi:helix-turn-helix transcriptional regulator [Dactylosporangium fulvum]|uniref:PadR family transcriptional regulator n=1 Tax=Dactylosporangium fulvum TaxID=53359 RepID=A0ABY5VSI7_9ACTN|nr:PadR family transcriptional regulator [Dactylosporangium fulvum]UWP79438.1 PadR family transcriptional regulator [Dactylosporangium fulvum]
MTPMREPTFLILTALAGRTLHGYAVIQEVSELSDGRVVLPAGTLYAALERLVAEGLVEPDRNEIVDGRHRRYYRLTDPGALALAADADRQRRNVATATERLRARTADRA